MKSKTKIKTNGGAAMMILVMFFVFISLTILIGIVTPVLREFRIASDNFNSKQSYFLAESGVEDVIYRMKNSLSFQEVENLVLGDSSAITTITDLGGGQKQISTLSDTDSHQRKVGVTLTTSTGVSFNYGVQVGQGGVYLDSGKINGNVYANGPITASSSGSNLISGTAISANGPTPIADQANGSGVPAYNITFANTNGNQDIAQSFKITSTNSLNKVLLYIKKTGNPNNATVKIMNDSNGAIGTTVLTSGTLSASAITNSYGWAEISFVNNSTLNAGTTYWLVVDASTSSNNCYIIGATNGGYNNGIGKIGRLGSIWNNTSPTGLDYYFNIYLGGVNGLISGIDKDNKLPIGSVSGTTQAHTVNYTNTTGNIYCKSGTGNNKSCIDQPDPVYIGLPVSEANIADWKEDALSGGIHPGDYTTSYPGGQTLGPKKINGNLNINSWGLTITGTLWVTGNVVMNGGGNTKLASSYGSNDAVIIVDGTITISNGAKATGSGTDGSYLMLLSQSNSTTAINIDGDAGAVITYAPYGTINVTGGSAIKEATGYKLNVIGNSSITYESGLANNNFSSGPSGTWSIDSWKEVE